MASLLDGKSAAVLVADGVLQQEVAAVFDALIASGAQVDIVAPNAGYVRASDEPAQASPVAVDRAVDRCAVLDYDGMHVAGGARSVGRLRASDDAIALVGGFLAAGKPCGARGHGLELLIAAGVARGRRLACEPTIATELESAEAICADADPCSDRGLVTATGLSSLEAFCTALVNAFAEGRNQLAAAPTAVDEASDESFPASDPPANYPAPGL